MDTLTSAGGVVYRFGRRGELQVLLCGRKSPPLWTLPKGTPEPGESREQTALREVIEETGLAVKNEGFIGGINYRFVRSMDKARCYKSVFFYLMSPTGGDIALHDCEFDEVRWFPAPAAFVSMTYGNEVEIVKKGLSVASQRS